MYSRLKTLRKNHHYSQEYLANILNITQAQYCKLEQNSNSLNTDKLIKLANLYDTSIDYILYLTDNFNSYPRSIKNPQDNT